jgi:four helix bundle protein
LENKKQKIESFEDLLVWQKARNIRRSISGFCKTLPNEEKFKLIDQLLRASRSDTANIAEGFGRFHFQENIQYCRQARGSLYEIIDHLSCAVDEKYLSEDHFKSYKNEIINCIQLVNGYIAYLRKSKLNKVEEATIDYTINE